MSAFWCVVTEIYPQTCTEKMNEFIRSYLRRFTIIAENDNKLKIEKYHTVKTFPKSSRKIVDRGKINIITRSLTFLA
jgi:hypothetical protein